MRTLWKFPISDVPNLAQTIDAPEGVYFVSVGLEDNGRQIVLWGMVNSEKGRQPRNVIVTFTGFELGARMDPFSYIGTVTMCDGTVVHVFDLDRNSL